MNSLLSRRLDLGLLVGSVASEQDKGLVPPYNTAVSWVPPRPQVATPVLTLQE